MKIKSIENKEFLDLVKSFGLTQKDFTIVYNKEFDPIHQLRDKDAQVTKRKLNKN